MDDLLATGGTAKCVSDMLLEQNKEILGLSVVIELAALKGRNHFEYDVTSVIKY